MTLPVLVQVGDVRQVPERPDFLRPHFFNEMPPEGTVILAPVDCIRPEHVEMNIHGEQDPSLPQGIRVFSQVRDADSYGLCVHFQNVWEEGTPLYVLATTKQKQIRGVQELLDCYWDLAFKEGIERRTHDTPAGDAQAVRSALEHAIRQMAGR
jgi:hypothetical protein